MKFATALGFSVICMFGLVAEASPVERVVKLLETLKEKLTADQKTEQQVYDKFACWCEKTTERHAKGIEAAEDQLRRLGSTILTTKGKISELEYEIADFAQQIAAAEAAVKEATSIRTKQNGEFTQNAAEIKDALVALQEAITVLAEAHKPDEEKTAFLQGKQRASAVVKELIRTLPSKVTLKPGQYDGLNMFLQESDQYAPQSWTVQGILIDMYATFARDLQDLTLDEANQNRDFEKLMALKADAKAEAEKEKHHREEAKAEAEGLQADTQEIFDDTTEQRHADIKFFDASKANCLSKHEEWEVRRQLRVDEIDGIQKAYDILTDSDARKLFASTIKAGKEVRADDSYDTGRDHLAFLQVQSSGSADHAATNAYVALKQQASKVHSLRLAALAVRVRLAKAGHFDGVITAINSMMQTLRDEDKSDIAKRDQCKEEYLKIESRVKDLTWKIKKNSAKIDKLTGLIELRTKERDETIAHIQDVDTLMADLTATRTAENTAFLASKSDDQDAMDLLSDAKQALAKYYKDNGIEMGPIQGSVKGLALAQKPVFDVSADQAPEAVFSAAGARKTESKDILSIMTMLIEDLNDEIKNDMKAEEEAQLEYEGLMKESTQLRAELVDKQAVLEAAIAARGTEKTDEELDKSTNEGDLKAEEDYKTSITDDCDFVLRTFEKRAAARTAEMQGLEGAKAYLVGYKPSETGLVQLRNARFLGLGR